MASLKNRLEKFKAYKAKLAKDGPHRAYLPKGPMIPRPEFDFPADASDMRHKYCWGSKIPDELFRNAKPADKILTFMRHQGWYGDDECGDINGVYVGHAAQIPARNGKEQWLSMVHNSDNHFLRISLEIFDSAEDAARDADRDAEIIARHEREFYEQDRLEQEAAQKLEDEREEREERTAQIFLRERAFCWKRHCQIPQGWSRGL